MTMECLTEARIPVSTYRLQFNMKFKFTDAMRIIPYLHALGISDIYSSPYLGAREGSLHGYDIIDHNVLNPEIGAEKEFKEMMDELHKYGMGQLLDIVPNHMCIASKKNMWWMDVLENGPSSFYASFFDIDWEPVKKELNNKILLPVLGEQYGDVLENRELQLIFENGSFCISYYDHKFPVMPRTYTEILEYNLDDLKTRLSPEDQDLIELLSIITAIHHLPSYTETDHERIEERHREKEIIKKRLMNVFNKSSDIRKYIEVNVSRFNGVKGVPESFDLLDQLLNRQIYRLSYWRVATEEINYRRFFDINELAAIRMEVPAVFQETHKKIFGLIKEDHVTGLRIDHPDGLYDPLEYFQDLQRECLLNTKGDTDNPPSKPFYIVGEKILIRGERMPEEWPIFSTTGYVFMNTVNGIFVDTANANDFDEIYRRFIKTELDFPEIVYEKKKLIMQVAMSSEINMLAHYLNRISEKNRHTRDFTLNSLKDVIMEVIAFFPVYRTYITSPDISDRDRRYIEQAIARAKRKNPAISDSVFNFLRAVLLLEYTTDSKEKDRDEWLDFTMRFQQITGPVMAKGVEDTAFYVYNRLVSLNEVGGSPERFGTPLEAFHGQNIERIKYWPHAMIATSTHDSKRSEDVRARIDVLSEIPDDWKASLIRWRRTNKKKKTMADGAPAPDSNDEYLLYQTLLGSWPVEPADEKDYPAYVKRIVDYMLKASREAKVNTSWISPNDTYEKSLIKFIEGILGRETGRMFLEDFKLLQKKISDCGMYNSLSQALLKITSPGVPDFYQGTEIWSLSLVDPDNRGPVNYEARIGMLEELKKREQGASRTDLARELTVNKEDGRIKLYLTYKALNYRRENRSMFDSGDYVPLVVTGALADHVVAFARIKDQKSVIVIIPRFLTGIISGPGDLPIGSGVWRDSAVELPFAREGSSFSNVLTGEDVNVRMHDGAALLDIAAALSNFPVAMLSS